MSYVEIYKVAAKLHAEGRIVRVLDAEGNPLTRTNRQGVPEQVWKLAEQATPEELKYWREHDAS